MRDSSSPRGKRKRFHLPELFQAGVKLGVSIYKELPKIARGFGRPAIPLTLREQEFSEKLLTLGEMARARDYSDISSLARQGIIGVAEAYSNLAKGVGSAHSWLDGLGRSLFLLWEGIPDRKDLGTYYQVGCSVWDWPELSHTETKNRPPVGASAPVNPTEKAIRRLCKRRALKGAIIAKNMNLDYDYVRAVLAKMVKRGLLKKVANGYRSV